VPLKSLLGLAAIAASISACDAIGIFSTSCTLEIRFAVLLEVVDSVSGQPVVDRDGTVMIADGAYADTVQMTAPGHPIGLASERPGTYSVAVRARGYLPWSMSGIRVRKDDAGCHVVTVTLTALLRPDMGSRGAHGAN